MFSRPNRNHSTTVLSNEVTSPDRRQYWRITGFAALAWANAAPLTVGATVVRPHVHQVAAAVPLVFDSVTVVDVEHGKLLPVQRVVIVGNRIQRMGKVNTVARPKGALVVAAHGKYLIPGLWDMHEHVIGYPDVFFPLFIANGVTGVRDMNTAHLDSLFRWRREIVAGERVGPRIVLTGGYLGNSGDFDSQIKVTTPEQARRVVDSLKAVGVDFIKTRDGLIREVYFAALAEARRIGIPLVGHISTGVTAAEASDSGQRTLEHVGGCPDGPPAQCAALAARFLRNDTWVTPTMALSRYFFGGVAPERLRFWPDTVRGAWAGMNYTSAEADRAAATQNLTAMIRAGFPLLAGTDAAPIFPENTPGFSLQEEVAWFVEGGLSPLDALRTATLNPAKYLHATDSLGTVATGKVADLVLLDADPLAEIHNIAKISAVVANGRYFNRAQLDSLITEVERRGRGRAVTPTP